MNHRSPNSLRRLLLTLLVSLVIGSISAHSELRRERVEAQRLIADMKLLVQSPRDVNKFVADNSSILGRSDCSRDGCAYVADLRNKYLAWFHIGPPSELYVSVTQGRDQLEGVYISLKTSISGEVYAATIKTVSAAECKAVGCNSFSSSSVKDSSGKILRSTILLGPAATAAERDIAFQIDVGCMFELTGCIDSSQITGKWPAFVRN
jgi:hypothetical protein